MNQFKPLCFLVWSLCLGAVINQETTTEYTIDVICSACVCEDDRVDCSNLGIPAPFTDTDWLGVSNPVQVNYSCNPLGTLPAFPSLPVQTLDLSSCGLETLPPAVFHNLEDLVLLDLSHNKLTTSAVNLRVFVGPYKPGSMPRQFTKIRTLNLAYNEIYSLEKDVFIFLRELTTLDLSMNPLAVIDQVTMAALTDLINLRELKLRGCELETLPEGLLRRQKNIRVLDLSDNRFTTIPAVLSEAANLINLNLGKNPIQTIPASNVLRNLTKLQELHLSRLSKLTTVESGALGIVNLEILEMNHNPRLTTLDPDFLIVEVEDGERRWPRLKELYLNNNNLSSISPHALARWDQLQQLDLTNNPYTCDCNIQWMVHTLTPILNGTGDVEKRNYLVCKYPAELSGLAFRYLYDAQKTLVCPENLIKATEAEGVIVIGVMIGVFITFPLVMVIVILWKKGFYKKCRGIFNRRVSYDDEMLYL